MVGPMTHWPTNTGPNPWEITPVKRITDGNRYAFEVEIPPPQERPNPDTVAATGRWNMVLPGDHPNWDRYVLAACSLADFPGVPPANKKFREATREVVVAAIDPTFPEASFVDGGVQIMSPMNYVEQIITTDEVAVRLMEFLADGFVHRTLVAEPSGIRGARICFATPCTSSSTRSRGSRIRAVCEWPILSPRRRAVG